MQRIAVTAIGWRAHAALAASGGAARPLGAPSGYLEAGGEIVWLGAPGDALHGRAILAKPGRLSGGDVSLDLGAVRPWRGSISRHVPERSTAEALAAAGERLCAALEEVGEPRGFGTLLAGRVPAFPLEAAA
ncbi:MAG TPA: hypothetical protein VLF19_12000, partial [Methylomirabilota bacterium]|nr:hypothetical protein [Methylomirabilota bacterium]